MNAGANTLRMRVIVALVAFFLLFVTMRHLWSSSPQVQPFSDVEEHPRHVRKEVVVASRFPFHFDVYMTVVWTLGRIMKEGGVRVFSDGPFRFDFQEVVESCGLFNSTLGHQRDFMEEMGKDERINLVILGTCEVDLKSEWSDALLKIWEARDAEHKFKIVCIVHNMQDGEWQKNIPRWSRRNAIRLLPISSHVGNSFRERFLELSRSPDHDLRSASYEYIPIDAHIPLLDISGLPSLPSRVLSNVVIQGSFDSNRRDYPNILAELTQSLRAKPQQWGYALGSDGISYVEDVTLGHPPFKLHLVGSGSLDVPVELRNVVVFHTDLSYPEFYRLMGGMDLCVPAFVLSEYNNNYKYQASSTIGMCLEVNVGLFSFCW